MDNFKIDIIGDCRETLTDAMRIAFRHNAAGGKAYSYNIVKLIHDGDNLAEDLYDKMAMIFRWVSSTDTPSFHNTIVNTPFSLDVDGAADFAWRWLSEFAYGDYDDDFDGTVKKGFRVVTGSWGHVMGDHYTICAVVPDWAEYGK